MHLYNLTIHKPSVVQRSIYGYSPKTEEFIISRGNIIELWRLDESGNVNVICSYEVYGLIRSLKPFRLSGNDTDFILIGSDSGRIVVLRFNGETNAFEKIHQETFGKVGVIRGLPGQYLAVDPTDRAFMINAIEKQNLVYVLNRDSKNNVTISSPLEAHKSQTIVLTTEGLDVGYDNPIFACLELNYAEADEDPTGEAAAHTEKLLTFYQLDLGLNHVIRKWSLPGVDGPDGVLVFAENWVLYRNEGHPELRVPIPRREFLPEDKGVLIVATSSSTWRTGKLGTARSPRLLGPRPIRLFKVVVEGQRCVLALSLKPWLCYCAGNTMMLTPLVCESMDFAACFNTPQCTDGLVMLRGADLQILRVDSLSQPFAAASMPLSYTPRQLAAYPGTSCLILLETEHHAFSELEKQAFYQQHGVAYVNEYDRGAPMPADREKWASCIRVVDAATLRTLERFELADNEAAFSVCVCPFHDKGEEPFVVIGTAKKRQEQH
ncbi:hypothetical protein WA577_001576 [Blastocystis sp. JDR]